MWGFVWGFAPRPTKNLRFLDFPLSWIAAQSMMLQIEMQARSEEEGQGNLVPLWGLGQSPKKASSVTFHEKRLDFNCGLSFIIRGVSVKHL